MRSMRQMIAQSGPTMLPMGAGRKSRSMEKVENATALHRQDMNLPTRRNK
ncbi:hypothetical protein [Bradyrhizobium sp. STM 3557]